MPGPLTPRHKGTVCYLILFLILASPTCPYILQQFIDPEIRARVLRRRRGRRSHVRPCRSSMLRSSPWLAPPRLVPEEVAQRSCVVRLPNFLTVDDIERLFAATNVVRRDLEQAGRVGLHDLAYRQSSPKQTWTTVFLNHRLAELLPDLHDRRHLCQK